MERMIGLIIIVAVIWIGVEVYSDGTENAFGGIFATLGLQSSEPQFSVPEESAIKDENEQNKRKRHAYQNRSATVPQAVKRRVQDAYQKSYDRVER